MAIAKPHAFRLGIGAKKSKAEASRKEYGFCSPQPKGVGFVHHHINSKA